MRWERLFADLEAQFEAAERRGLENELAERVRAEVGAVPLLDRARAAAGGRVVLRAGGEPVTGDVVGVGSDHLLIAEYGSVRALVPAAAVDSIAGLGRVAVAEPSPVAARLGLGSALRALERARQRVRVVTRSGHHAGVVTRVGADHLDVATATAPAPGAGTVVVPFAAVLVVRSTS